MTALAVYFKTGYSIYLSCSRWCCEWTCSWGSDGVSAVFSPGQAVEFDILVVDLASVIDLAKSEAGDVWVRGGWWADTVELPLPDELVAFNCQAD